MDIKFYFLILLYETFTCTVIRHHVYLTHHLQNVTCTILTKWHTFDFLHLHQEVWNGLYLPRFTSTIKLHFAHTIFRFLHLHHKDAFWNLSDIILDLLYLNHKVKCRSSLDNMCVFAGVISLQRQLFSLWWCGCVFLWRHAEYSDKVCLFFGIVINR